ncbi:MAG: protein-disulfide isomerase, partial [Sphingorhabdus sp.]|nr:protein-disulfide isomerase [Sphingorhabdus sp.]
TVAAMTEDAQKQGVKGTPSFMLNGKLLDGVYSWQALKPLLPAS